MWPFASTEGHRSLALEDKESAPENICIWEGWRNWAVQGTVRVC